MKKTLLASLVVGAAVGVVFVTGGNEANASEVDGVWTPRTVDQIKADIAKAKDNKYTIVWGDTLGGISQATNLTVQKLAEMNKIANVDLIYAGNTLVFEGNVVTAKNAQGETVVQTVVQPQDKNDANKPVGKQEPAKQATNKAKETATTQNSQATNTPSETAPVQNNQVTTTSGTTVDTTNSGTSVSHSETTGSQSGTVATANGEATTSSSQGETPAPTTGSSVEQPADSQSVQPSTPVQPATPAQPSTGGNQGGTTISVTDPSTVTDQEPDPAMIGNSGKVFNSEEAARSYGEAEATNPNSKWYGYEWQWWDLVNKNNDPIGKWSVGFNK
ncbi:LysM peptidoglycan-binding domain-containing protein [Enterococcus faecium]|uniref:LysM domain-containing protein n=1 Tax=Enterococcus faecium TaxID=1352 RepID=A0A242BCB3_ENTFC|nr:LysM peptidoglycan-binding domain-containing protein [Enterococcus faecium]OTN93146.1 hypothetical protein A5810_002605 [Enterococcus faecium]